MLARSAVLGVLLAAAIATAGGRAQGRPTIAALSADPNLVTGGDVLVRIAFGSKAPAGSPHVARRRPRRVEGLSACGRARCVRRARHRPRERKEPHRGRRESGNRSRIARGRQLPDHRTGHLGTVAAAVHLPDDRVRLARWIDARSAARCELLGPDGRPARLSIDVGSGDLQAAAGRAARFQPDVAKTTTSEGRTVNFIVRVETGTMNRGIYQNAVLHDPTSEPAPTPVLAAERMEPPPHRAARFGLSLGLVHPGRTFRRQHSRQPAAGAGLRACSSTRSITRPTAATRSSPPKRR